MPDENPSIGIILCADRNNVEVEVALQGSTAPIGVSEYSYPIPQKQIKELINNELSGNKGIEENSRKENDKSASRNKCRDALLVY